MNIAVGKSMCPMENHLNEAEKSPLLCGSEALQQQQGEVQMPPATPPTEQSRVDELLAAQRSRLQAQRKAQPLLFLRNILNVVFMLLAAITIIGLFFFEKGSAALTYCYYIGIVAVLIKMVEVMFRMPGFKKQPRRHRNFHAPSKK